MPAPKKTAMRHATAADTSDAVNELLRTLQHPFKAEIEAIRSAILAADPEIKEGVKWNAPSFRTHEYFATTNLREKEGVGVILHLGAKVRDLGPQGMRPADPDKLLKWLAPDRASVKFADMHDLESKRAAFVKLISAWITHV